MPSALGLVQLYLSPPHPQLPGSKPGWFQALFSQARQAFAFPFNKHAVLVVISCLFACAYRNILVVCVCKVLLVCNMYLRNCNIFHCIHAGGRANEVRLREKNEGAGEGDLWSQNLKLNWRKQGRIIVEAICCGNGINWCFIVLREGALPKQIEMTNKTSPNWSIVLMNKFPGQKCFVEWKQFSFKLGEQKVLPPFTSLCLNQSPFACGSVGAIAQTGLVIWVQAGTWCSWAPGACSANSTSSAWK